MGFSQIIKKAWTITWRYRYLWVLGLFAGITGASGGGGSFSGGQSFGSGGSGSSGTGTSPFSATALRQFVSGLQHWLPAIIAGLIFWFLLGLLWWLFAVAARGGLVWAVNELEEGRQPSLGAAWKEGFAHFWRVVGLGLLLQLPVLLVLIILVAAIAVPVMMAISRGGNYAAAAIVPVCGSLVIALPLLLVMSFIFGIMYVIALRRIVLDGIGVIRSAGDAWRTFRSRFKDTAVMWLINWGLNIAAGIALAIPMVILSVALVVPGVFAGIAGNWGMVIALIGVWLIIVIVLSFLYSAIWGTFTSALWTILYRRLTGREQVWTPENYAAPAQPAGPPIAPSYPIGGYVPPGGPPSQPSPPSADPGQPIEGWPPPPPA